MGQTSQELSKRIQKHISTITLADRDSKAGKKITPVAEHFLGFHHGKCVDLQIVGTDKVQTTIRGGDLTAA